LVEVSLKLTTLERMWSYKDARSSLAFIPDPDEHALLEEGEGIVVGRG